MSSLVGIRVTLVRTHLQEWTNASILATGVLIAFFAEREVFAGSEWTESIILFIVAIAISLWAFRSGHSTMVIPVPSVQEPARSLTRVGERKWFVAGCVLFALVAFAFSGDNTFTVIGVESWILSIAFFLAAFWEVNWEDTGKRVAFQFAKFSEWSAPRLRIKWSWAALAAILIVSGFFYYYRLDSVPAEMTSDHAEKILDVNDILSGKRPIFFERNTGREPLEFYMITAVVELGHVPLKHIALKIVTATLGLLAVPFVFLMVRELFDDVVALVAAFFTGVSIWPVAIARVGLRFPFTPLFIAATMFFLIRGLKKSSRNDMLLAGLTMGIGLMGYNAFRIAPVLVLVLLLIWPVLGKNVTRTNLRAYVTNSILLFAAALLAFLPLFHYSLEHPENFWYRALSRVTENGALAPNPLLVFIDNTWRAIWMFNFVGDQVWVNSVPNQPVVDYLTGGLVLIGAAFAIYRLLRFREYAYALILVGLVVMLFPSTLVVAFPNENPSVVRAGGAIPFVMTLAALPAVVWIRQMRATMSNPLFALAPLALLFVLVIRTNYDRYFYTYDEQYRLASWNSSEIAYVLKGFSDSVGDSSHAYLISFPYWVDHRNVGINMGDPLWDNRIMDTAQLSPQASDPAPKLYVLNTQDSKSLQVLEQLYPKGTLKTFPARTPTREFLIFFVPPGGS